MEFKIIAKTELTLEFIEGSQYSNHIATKVQLKLSDNLDEEQYFDEKELPNVNGSKALTNAFVQGLIGNIHYAHQKGQIDSAEHLRHIISELERGFIQIVNINESDMP